LLDNLELVKSISSESEVSFVRLHISKNNIVITKTNRPQQCLRIPDAHNPSQKVLSTPPLSMPSRYPVPLAGPAAPVVQTAPRVVET
jgi:hypothetical protein